MRLKPPKEVAAAIVTHVMIATHVRTQQDLQDAELFFSKALCTIDEAALSAL
jgi:hypothetical protein